MKLNDSKLFRQQALINGEWLDANNGEVIDVTNPANGDKLEPTNRLAPITPAIDNMVTWRDFSPPPNSCGCDDCPILNPLESVSLGRAPRHFPRRVTRIIVIDSFCRRAAPPYPANIDFFLFTYRLSDAA